jgi:hypothetical protein
MSHGRPPEELSIGYEALRAQAIGQFPTETPRGLALLLTQGTPAWIRAWPAQSPPAPRPTVTRGERTLAPGLGAEVVRLLTEMAVACRGRLAIP